MATVLTNTGIAKIIACLFGDSHTPPVYVAWGTGSGTASATDTTLFTEASESRVSGTKTKETTTVTDDTYQVVGTMTAGGSKTITNAGLFDASTSGNLYIKGDFTGIALTSGDKIEFTFKLTQS